MLLQNGTKDAKRVGVIPTSHHLFKLLPYSLNRIGCVWLAGIPSAITCICSEKDLYESLMQKAKSGQKLTTGEIKWLATVYMITQTDKIMDVWVQIMDALHPLGQDMDFHYSTNNVVAKCLRGEV